jgi:hypothetical protein
VSTHDPLALPTRFNGHFGLVIYHQHHGVLLLRSHDRDDGGPRRVDVVFRGVVWMSLPAWFEAAIEPRSALPLALRMTTGAHFMQHRYTDFNRPLRIVAPPSRG